MKKIAAFALFGRPMECLDRCLFVDVVSGKEVGLYRDLRTGSEYMASGPWSWFRVALSGVQFQ